MGTHRELVRVLCKSIITRLENRKAVVFPPRLRQVVQDEVFGLVGPYIMTDEDIRERALAKMGAKPEAMESATENEAFRAAKAVVKGTLGDHELNGFYFQKPIKEVAKIIAEYLMRSSHIDDVFESDEEIEQGVVDTIKGFDPADLH